LKKISSPLFIQAFEADFNITV